MHASPHDLFLWHTINITELVAARRYDDIATVPVPFAAMDGDAVWASAPFELHAWESLRARNYRPRYIRYRRRRDLTSVLSRAIVETMRQEQARADAVPRWVHNDQGTLFISDYGFYLMGTHGLNTWTWKPVTSMQWIAPRQVEMTGVTQSERNIRWLFTSDAAELLFSIWALTRHPEHPQHVSRSWLDPNWVYRITAAGFQPPPSADYYA